MSALDVAGVFGNAVTATLLAAAGIAALVMATRGGASALPAYLLLLMGAGLCFLGVDEGFDVHERLGTWLYERGVEAPGPINHVDDAILLAYIAAGAIATALALPALLRARHLFVPMIAAAAMMAGATAFDALATPGAWTEAPEEALEACGAALLAYVFVRDARQAESAGATVEGGRRARINDRNPVHLFRR